MHAKSPLIVGGIILGLLTACSSTPKAPVNAPLAAAAKMMPRTADPRSVTPVVLDALDDPAGALAKRSVYFDFDDYTVKPAFAPLVTAHANYLVKNLQRKVVIQGNTDERGGAEYNLALGEKRAQAVLHAMAVLGVPETRMEAVSFGKEKPKASAHDEAAWAENRRADIYYGK